MKQQKMSFSFRDFYECFSDETKDNIFDMIRQKSKIKHNYKNYSDFWDFTEGYEKNIKILYTVEPD